MNEDEFNEWYDQFGMLTYGEIDDEYILNSFKTILQWKKDSVFISDNIPDNKFTTNEYWLLLSYLHECIDFGSSPRGAWLSDFGIKVLSYLDEHGDNFDE